MRSVDALCAALEIQVEVAWRLGPTEMARSSRCAGWSVAEVLGHSVGVTAKFTRFAAGETDRPRTPTGDLLRPDHRAAVRSVADEAAAAWTAADLARTCDLPFGSFPAELAAGINLFDVLAHTWDITDPLGLSIAVPDQLWETGLAAARTVIGADRDTAHYGPEVLVAPTAAPEEHFLGFLGRRPRST